MKLSTLSFALLTAASYINLGSAQENILDLVQTFREPKNILFSVSMGGSSHSVWVLSILEELAARGHHAKFFTRDDQIRFAKKFPSVKPISSGPSVFTKEEYARILPELIAMEPVAQSINVIENFSFNYTEEYYKHRDIFNIEKVDLVVCDHFNMACSDAAEVAGLPFVVTSSLAYSPDTTAPYINVDIFNSHHPTSKGVSFFTRLNDKVISPLRFIYGARHTISKLNQEKKSIGLKVTMDPMDVWKDSIKIVELIGPIVPLKHAGLNSELQTFLDHRRKVVYVAFGQMAIPSRNDIKMILTAMLENMETDAIDGIIWSTRGIEELFPEYITTRSNTTYDIRSLFKSSSTPNETNIAFVNWAPQVAILHHPSTTLFLTHGGAGSLHESLYNGVPVVVFPFFGDQPATATMAEENGYGRYLKCHS
ncbi:hypothetical protein G6F66_012138 [Rhizopus arrhizus]|nr:hypothetical protein G6F66_012138 [Rhizopus arrhizus]